MQKNRERSIKKALIEQLKRSNKVSIKDIVEWLWEDFGIRCRAEWRDIERKMLKNDEISPNDIAVFMIEHGLKPEEDVWFEGDM